MDLFCQVAKDATIVRRTAALQQDCKSGAQTTRICWSKAPTPVYIRGAEVEQLNNLYSISLAPEYLNPAHRQDQTNVNSYSD